MTFLSEITPSLATASFLARFPANLAADSGLGLSFLIIEIPLAMASFLQLGTVGVGVCCLMDAKCV